MSEEKQFDASKKNDVVENKPFIPLKKQSKQKQKEYHASKRGIWGDINPVTRKPPNPKAYDRKKIGKSDEEREEKL